MIDNRIVGAFALAGIAFSSGALLMGQISAPSTFTAGSACTGSNSVFPATDGTTLKCNGSTLQPTAALVSPRVYGAVCDGSTNDATALQNWMNSGKPLILDGRCAFASAITVTLSATGVRGLSIVGMGPNSSQLISTAVSATVTINIGAYSNPIGAGATLNFRDWAMVPAIASVGNTTNDSAINLIGSAQSGSSQPLFNFSNFHVLATTLAGPTAQFYYDGGIYLQDIRQGTIQNCVIFGGYNLANGSGIKIRSTSITSSPVDIHISDCTNISHWQNGIEIFTDSQSDVQGVYITSSTLLAVVSGVYWDGALDPAGQARNALLKVSGTHVQFGRYAIHAINVAHPMISNNYFLGDGANNGTGSMVGIDLAIVAASAGFGQVHGNTINFQLAGAIPTRTAISSGGTLSNNVICGNLTYQPAPTGSPLFGYSFDSSTKTCGGAHPGQNFIIP